MSFPQIAGLEVQEALGTGCAGTVYRAMGPGGVPWALKIINSMAVNRKGLESALNLLQAMPAHRGVLPVLGFDLVHSPYYIATALVGQTGPDGSGGKAWQTPTLESVCGKLPPEHAWSYIYEISESLAHMHRYGVAHGNITTANVLLSNEEDSVTRITDVAQGWVGGTHHIELRHHYLFLCPDQAESADLFFQGYGHSWDVYSFGVVAYRLLTGQYPRGFEAWVSEMGKQQAQAAKGLTYTLNGMAIIRSVRDQPRVSWPTPPSSKWEERRRKIIEIALEIDSGSRWVDMRDVAREFETLEADFLLEEAKAATEAERVKQAKRVARLRATWMGLAATLTAVSAYAVITQLKLFGARDEIEGLHVSHAGEVKVRDEKISGLTKELTDTQEAKKGIDANLQRSQVMVDQMLTQLLQLPTGNNLEVAFSREQLTDAADFLRASLAVMEKDKAMGPERARAFGNLGMIYLKQRRTVEAQQYLDKARQELHALLQKDPKGPHAGVQHQWLGRYSLLLANITSARGDGDAAMQLLNEATENLDPGLKPGAGSRPARFEAAQAWFNLGVRKRLESDATGAAAALGKVAEALDEAALGGPLLDDELFTLARAELEQGLALRDAGKMDDAISTLISAVEKMSLLVSGSAPKNQDQALVLAEAYTELAEVIAKHLTPKEAAEAYQEAEKVLIELIRLEPDWVEAKYLMARNYGAQAGISRDEGRPSEALTAKKNAIEQIGEVVSADPDNPRFLFLKAKLKGELAEILTDLGQAKAALAIVEDAVKTMEGVLQKGVQGRIAAERKDWEIQMAVLYGIKGQTLEAAKKSDDAKVMFTSAEKQWMKLAELDKTSARIQQGLEWTRNRLSKIR